MEESLTGRVIAAHGDIVRKLHNVEEAQRARDAFTKVGMILLISWFPNVKEHKLLLLNNLSTEDLTQFSIFWYLVCTND